MDPVIVQAAITGSITDPGRTPHLPITADAIVADAVAVWRAGASVIHLHARQEDGMPTQDVGRYRLLFEAIRASGCDAILNLSSGSAGGRVTGPARYAHIELGPELATYDCGSINFGEWLFEAPLPFLRTMAADFLAAGVRAEIECFDVGHVGTAMRLHEEGLLPAPLCFQFVLGVGGVPASISQVEHMRSLIPDDARWSVCALGPRQLPLNLYCLAEGGHVRTGLEDNIYFRKGELATNVQLVERIGRIAAELGRPVATPAEARRIFEIETAAPPEASST